MKFAWPGSRIAVAAISLLVGLITVAPSLFSVFSLGSDYKGIPFFYIDDEYNYTTRIQEVVDGHGFLGSAYLYEYKDKLPVMPPLGEYLYALPTIVLSVSPVQTIVFFKFLFNALLFLLVYHLFKSVSKGSDENHWAHDLGGVAAGLAVVFLYDQICLRALMDFDHKYLAHMWSRPVNPILGALVLFAFLAYSWKYLNHDKRKDAAIAILLLGVSFFYFFSWGLIISCLVFAFISASLGKKWKELKKISLIASLGALCSVPWVVISVLALRQGGSESASRFGMFYTHLPTLNKFVAVTLLVFLATSLAIWLFQKRKIHTEPWWVFCLVVILGSFWVYSQPIVTGMSLWPYHFSQYTKPLMIFVLLMLGHKTLRLIVPRLWSGFLVILCVLSLASGMAMAASNKNNIDDFRKIQKNYHIIDWFNRQAQKDCVVLIKGDDEMLTNQITALTHCNLYMTAWVYSGVPRERVLHGFYVDLRLKGVTPETAGEYLRKNPMILRRVYFNDWNQLLKRGGDDWTDSQIQVAVKGYAEFFSKDFSAELRKYKLDYLVSPTPFNFEDVGLRGMESKPVEVGGEYIYKMD